MLLGSATNPNNRYIHSGWPTANGTHLIFHDELEEIQLGLPTQIYTLNLADLRAPTVQLSHTGPTSTTDHNGYMRGNYYYVSHYRRGVVVFDASNPDAARRGRALRQLPHAEREHRRHGRHMGRLSVPAVRQLLVSDIENGLFVLRDHARTLDAEQSGGSDSRRSRRNGARARHVQRAACNESSGVPGRQRAVRDGGRLGDRRRGLHGQQAARCNGAPETTPTRTSSIPVRDDASVEGAETLTVTLSAPTGRRDARRLERVDGDDQRQRHQPAAERRRWRWRRLDGLRAARAARGRPARPRRAARRAPLTPR